MKDSDVCKTILRTLTPSFNVKVTILEDKDLLQIKVDDFQASLTAYEMRIGIPTQQRRETAFKAKEVVEKAEQKSEDEDDLEDDKKEEEDSDTEVQEILEERERCDFVAATMKNTKLTPVYIKKTNLLLSQMIKDKRVLVKTKMMWIPKKLNSVSKLVYTTFKACNSNDGWYIDSGCLRHMTGDSSKFLSLKKFNGGNVVFGDNQKAKIVGIGTICKINEIDNNIKAFGKDVKESDVYKKILKTLTPRFNAKVTILEDKDLSQMKVDDFQASLTTYEMRIGFLLNKEEKLKAREVVEKAEQKSEDEDDLEDDEVAYLAKKFRKFRFKKRTYSHNQTFYSYGKSGHYVANCPNSKGQNQKKVEIFNNKGRFGRKVLISD
ncbi:uncharacterized protein LOC132313900 [Cornus florida]|uniref:uncharacterized protein LOC132313900 n=1 Tax=Cornus florida TaxID=4283 RepID=UPI0028A12D61|nr:uncharacterized protein LOC132313900 [Cornus florida]